MNPDPVFSQELCLPYSAVNANGQVKAEWLLNIFQDAASHHCHQLEISGLHMASKQLKWVVAQYDIQIKKPVCWLEPLTLHTWRAPWKNLYEVRQFTIQCPQTRAPVVSGTGVWVLVRAKTTKPVRLSTHLPGYLMDTPGSDPKLVRSRPEFDDAFTTARFKVLFHDLDLNQHVNNTIYLKWALESLPAAHRFDHVLSDIKISYLKECFYPESVICRVKLSEQTHGKITTDHSIVRAGDTKELARIILLWTPNTTTL